MFIKIGETDYEAKFTFNSFKHLKDFDISELNELESKPFAIIDVTERLFYGALNHDKSKHYLPATVETMLEDYATQGGSIAELFELLMVELEESDFFKNLRK